MKPKRHLEGGVGIDGVATKYSNTQVYKIPTGGRLTVNADGGVTPNLGVKGNSALLYKSVEDSKYKWGWLYRADLDDKWDQLIQKAKDGVR